MNNQKKLLSGRVIIQLLLFIVLEPFLPLLISRHWGWWEAWGYGSLSVLGFAVSRALAARRHPDLIEERSQFMQQENVKTWDKKLAPLLGLGGLLVMLAAGLEALLTYLATPFFLDSLWAFLPTLFIAVILVIRTALEDRFLQEELEGYRDYAKRVRFRLLPGVW